MIDKHGVEVCDVLDTHFDKVSFVRDSMPPEDELFDLAELFKIFGDTTRMKILYALFESEMCVCDIAAALDMTQSAISHQLRLIKTARLIKSRRLGRTILYSLADDHVATIIGMAKEHLEEL
ncbi:MAG: helix-turn-helix transcriptional regulator [Oscillospiraceae bacterium]|nr:helix-turn-helix transcriptional regulator [Oscillospiraceae bacterium]